MKVVVVSAFDTYFDRVKLLKKYYEEKGYEVQVVSSSFSHRKKQTVKESFADILIPTMEYQKNLSIARLRNHYEFAQKAKKKMEELNPDIIHCLIPCNSLCKTMSEYKKNHDVILYFDLIDLWPETMPINRLKNLFPFTIWKNIRDNYLKDADKIFTECHLYKDVLHLEHAKTLYWSREIQPIHSHVSLLDSEMNFCYLGSINNIIDIDFIVKFLEACTRYKKVRLHLIGNGEMKDSLVNRCMENGISIIDYKEVYDQEKKQEIFDSCHYALNVMKPSVVVGLTMKSLDYLCGGLPLINTIKGDTTYLCETENLGWNVNDKNLDEIVSSICSESIDEQMQRRENCKRAYLTHFTYESFKEVLDSVEK